jgi:hypothetical protein
MMHESGTEWAHHRDEPSSVQSVVAQRFAELDIDGDGERLNMHLPLSESMASPGPGA